MTLEGLAWTLAGGTYAAVTAAIAVDSADDDSSLLGNPANWIFLPIVGLIIAAPLGTLMLTVLLILQRIGVLPERWIIPGMFVVWTAVMIAIKIDKVRDARKMRKREVRKPAYFSRFAPSAAGRAAVHPDAAPEPAGDRSLLAVLAEHRPHQAAPDAATEACEAPANTARPVPDTRCESPTPSHSHHAWDSGADSSDSGGDSD